MTELTLRDNARNTVEVVSADVLYVMIGPHPHTDWLAGTLALDEQAIYFGERTRCESGASVSVSSLQGFVTMPPNPPVGVVIWKMLWLSGNA